ncbi:head-tail connector protein [Roseicyclus sp.]|uniref:head-tail connector protein n=1 Tax=Roseicyclus sp. TaxID=1914329 RepID=UPI003F6A9080
MMMVELTATPSAALPVATLAAHLRLAQGFVDDASQNPALERCLRAACAAIEARIGKALFARRFLLTVLAWQSAATHPLPLAPVREIVSIRMFARDGTAVSVDPSGYRLQPDMHRPLLVASGAQLPQPAQAGSVEVEFAAGFGPAWDDIPVDLQQAVIILAGTYWGQDSDPSQGLPHAVAVLLEPHRPVRLRGGGA